MSFSTIPEALDALRRGDCLVVVDDENRENEGDLICAAQFTTPRQVNFMASEARGLICLAMEAERLEELDLPPMVDCNTDSNQTAFTVSIDAAPEHGVSTGISAEDRARTIQVAIGTRTRPKDLRRPGHIFPLRAREGGVLKRAGHTEAAVDLARMAGLYPAGVICEIQNPDGSMARLPELETYAEHHGLCLVSIADIIRYRLHNERFITRVTTAQLPSRFGNFQAVGFRNELDGREHLAIVRGPVEQLGDGPVLTRIHSECLTGDALGSLRCDCREQLQAALRMIEAEGRGLIVYLRQEGRGIGLINKLRAYNLQDLGLDTVEANERLGFGADLRDYGIGAQILYDLGIHQLRLITNNPRKVAGLGGYGLEISERVPLVMEPSQYNRSYLKTKAQKLGHMLQGVQVVLGLDCKQESSAQQRGQLLEQVETLAQAAGVVTTEEVQTRTKALLYNPDLTVRLAPQTPTAALGPLLQVMVPQLVAQASLRRLQVLVGPDPQQSSHPRADVPVLDQPGGDWSALAKVDHGGHCLLCWGQPRPTTDADIKPDLKPDLKTSSPT